MNSDLRVKNKSNIYSDLYFTRPVAHFVVGLLSTSGVVCSIPTPSPGLVYMYIYLYMSTYIKNICSYISKLFPIMDDPVCMLKVFIFIYLFTGKFNSDLYSRIMNNLVLASTDNEWKTVIMYMDVMKALVLSKLAYVINVQLIKDINLSNCDMQTHNLQDVPLSDRKFIDLQCYMSEDVDAKVLLTTMNYLLKENPEVRWDELDWFISV